MKAQTPAQGNKFLVHFERLSNKRPSRGTPLREASERNSVWYGFIGSGDKLMKNAQRRDELRGGFDLIGLEMEAAGTINSIAVGVIRGVCDYVDERKNKGQQPYAAGMAAAYAREVLHTISPRKGGVKRKMGKALEVGGGRLSNTYNRESCGNPSSIKCSNEIRGPSFGHIDSRLNTITPAHRNPCNWIFRTEEFLQLRDPKEIQRHNGVLWVKNRDYLIAAYFFNARGEDLEKTPLGMILSLVYQLVDKDSLICNHFIPLFLDKQKKHGDIRRWHEEKLESFLLREIKTRHSRPLLLLIDALDECKESDVRSVVACLESLSISAVQSRSSLHIILSSRHYPHISMRRKCELFVERQEHDQDIQLCFRDKLVVSDTTIEEDLLHNSNHVFMWVILVVEILNQEFDDGNIIVLKNRLREIPSDLDDLLYNILARNNSRKQATVLMMQWVLFSQTLLAPEKLYFAVIAGT
ncbi:MAG: hypothetical protein M1818_001853 [Claussenomyces sp. TS43310]|nr:MAG: hypothetical protein M1818_001853 [Claussenomyces sp. TS43310]